MNEYKILFLAIGALEGLVIAALLYGLGGRRIKGIRRFGASAILTITVCLTSFFMGNFSVWLLGLYIFKVLEYIQGYSADRGLPGWAKRGLIGVTSVLGGVYLCWVFGGGWWLLAIHLPLSASTMLFSKKNPLPAAVEEPLVCALNSLIIVLYPFIN